MSDLARTLAFAFRRKGATSMGRLDLQFLLAMDLRWFAPEDAKGVVARGIETGLLVEEGDHLRPAFDPGAVDVPVGFRPDLRVLDEEDVTVPTAPPPIAPPPPPALEEDTEVMAERARRGGLVSAEVAALLVARRRGEDVRARAEELEKRLLAKG